MLKDRLPDGRRPLAAAALLAAAAWAGCDAPPEEGVLVLEPGRVVATYPAPEDGDAPSLGHLAALELAGEELYVVDQLGGRVHRFAPDGEHLNGLGRKGEGPGELQRPTEVTVGPEGDVWVADPPSGRVTRFRPDGTLVSLRRAPYGGTDFGLLPSDRMVVPSPTPGRLLALVGPEDGITELAPGPKSPAALASTSPEERFGFMATFLEADPRSGAVFLLLNREEYSLWDLRVDPGEGVVADARRVPMPAWLTGAMEATMKEQRAGLDEAGLQFVPFNDLRRTPSGLWMTTGPIGALGVALPVDGEGRPVVVRPALGADGGDDRFRGLLHARLDARGLYAVYATRVRLFALDTVGVRDRPELP